MYSNKKLTIKQIRHAMTHLKKLIKSGKDLYDSLCSGSKETLDYLEIMIELHSTKPIYRDSFDREKSFIENFKDLLLSNVKDFELSFEKLKEELTRRQTLSIVKKNTS